MNEATQTSEAPPPAAPVEQATAEPSLDFAEAAKSVFGDGGEAPAAEPVAAEPAVEPVAEAPQENPRVAARIAAATRAEIRAAEARKELRAQEEAIAKARADLDEREKRYKLLEEDPVKAFDVLKLDPKTFLEKLAGEHKPENVQAKELAALKAELEAIKNERNTERETAKQRELRMQTEQVWTEASKGFVQHIEATADKYPNLVAEYTEAEAIGAAERALLEVVGQDDAGKPVTRADAYFQKFGEYPDNDVIAEFLDAQAKQRAEARQNSGWRKQVSAPGSQPLLNGDSNPKAPPVNKGSSPRTLTSRAASEKASPPKGWSQEAADAESIRILQSAFKD